MKVEIGNAILYHGDCLEILPSLPKVDAVITDPPYGSKTNNRGASSKRGGSSTLKSIEPIAKDWPDVIGDDKPFDPSPFLGFEKIILWGGNWYGNRLPAASKWIVWDKRNGSPPDDNADAELAWTNLKGPTRIYRQLWRGVCREGEENAAFGPKVHPNQKPVALGEFCLQQCKIERGQHVADFFMGSGSFGVAAVRNGFKYTGIELRKEWFDIACERIDQAQRQGRMFA